MYCSNWTSYIVFNPPHTCSNAPPPTLTLCYVWSEHPLRSELQRGALEVHQSKSTASNWDKAEITAIISATLVSNWANFWARRASSPLLSCLYHLGIHSEQKLYFGHFAIYTSQPLPQLITRCQSCSRGGLQGHSVGYPACQSNIGAVRCADLSPSGEGLTSH